MSTDWGAAGDVWVQILQFDLRTADVVQEYNYHLGAINSVTLIDENRRFVSTSGECCVVCMCVWVGSWVARWGWGWGAVLASGRQQIGMALG